MTAARTPTVAIVDYGLGNLYSVKQACEHARLDARITRRADEILAANAVILPGVGAFGDAMATLRQLGLIPVIRDVVDSGTAVIGICLGAQLLMSASEEFGEHEGLGIFNGRVVRFDGPVEDGRPLKVPHIAWSAVSAPAGRRWDQTLLAGLREGECMYFVHSFILEPEDDAVVVSVSRYGQIEFCSSMQRANVFACQFHPERSGPRGLQIYANLAAALKSRAVDGTSIVGAVHD